MYWWSFQEITEVYKNHVTFIKYQEKVEYEYKYNIYKNKNYY